VRRTLPGNADEVNDIVKSLWCRTYGRRRARRVTEKKGLPGKKAQRQYLHCSMYGYDKGERSWTRGGEIRALDRYQTLEVLRYRGGSLKERALVRRHRGGIGA